MGLELSKSHELQGEVDVAGPWGPLGGGWVDGGYSKQQWNPTVGRALEGL